jgi:uncharacterized protein involved in exopolysaccharide biosynthesis
MSQHPGTTPSATATDSFAEVTVYIRKLVQYLRKWGRTLAIFLTVGTLLGVLAFLYGPKRYSHRVLLNLDDKIINGVNQALISNELQDLVKGKDYAELARKMSLSQELVSKISRIDAEAPKLVQPEINNRLGDAWVYVWVKDANFPTDSLTHGLLFYLNSNSYIKEQLNLRTDVFGSRLKKVLADQRKLDSLRTVLPQKVIEGGMRGNMVLSDFSDMYDAMDRLYRAELEIRMYLANNKVQVVKPFDVPRTIFPLDWYLMAAIGGVVFFFLGILYLRLWKEERIFS